MKRDIGNALDVALFVLLQWLRRSSHVSIGRATPSGGEYAGAARGSAIQYP
jgi:hypothetical protein